MEDAGAEDLGFFFFFLPGLKLPIPSLPSAHCECIKGINSCIFNLHFMCRKGGIFKEKVRNEGMKFKGNLRNEGKKCAMVYV